MINFHWQLKYGQENALLKKWKLVEFHIPDFVQELLVQMACSSVDNAAVSPSNISFLP